MLCSPERISRKEESLLVASFFSIDPLAAWKTQFECRDIHCATFQTFENTSTSSLLIVLYFSANTASKSYKGYLN